MESCACALAFQVFPKLLTENTAILTAGLFADGKVGQIVTMANATSNWKSPPKEKIYEAISAILDDRVERGEANAALVWSSDRSKFYTVTWDADGRAFGSNDNASFFQGYVGYPIIAALFQLRTLEFDLDEFSWLKGVPWKAINKMHKNDYAKAVAAVMEEKLPDQARRAEIEAAVDDLHRNLLALELGRLKPAGRPPK